MLLTACSVTRYSTPIDTDELESQVLVIRETSEGQVTHSWQKASEFDLWRHHSQMRNDSMAGHLVPAAWTRNCDQELLDCHRDCMRRPVPPEFNQYEYTRKRGGRADYCNKVCMQPYLDCKELEKLHAQEFTAVDEALDWLKRNREALLVGTVVVISGVVFVTVSAGGGLIILAPALLMTSSMPTQEPSLAKVSP